MTALPDEVLLIEAPYDSGNRGVRMGAGPSRLAPHAAERLRMRGHHVEHRLIELDGWRAELRSAFELHRAVASAVAGRGSGQVPLLLAGNCNTALGVLAGTAVPGRQQGLIWLDAHGDFNTPDTDPTGFLDGQGLAMAVGRCWRAATDRVPGFRPVPEDRVLLIGARQLDDEEERALHQSEVHLLPPAAARDARQLDAELAQLAPRIDSAHLHIDLDVHDLSSGSANGYSVPDGLSADEVRDVVESVAARLTIGSASLASYDPEFDEAERMHGVALEILELLASLLSCQPRTEPRQR